MKRRTSFNIGRDASTGRFVSIRMARSRPSTTVIEEIPIKRRNAAKATKR